MSMFSFVLDRGSGVPIYRQLVTQVWAAIASRELAPGGRLPTVRAVAVDLAINPNTVAKAYRELEIQGVLETQQGSGTFVSARPLRSPEVDRAKALDDFCRDWLARAGEKGFTTDDLTGWLREQAAERQAETRS